MTQPEAVFFDCDGTLVDSEVICSRAYVHMFQEFGITLDLAEIFKRFKGVKLYEIIDTINAEYGVNLQKATLEPIYRAEVARLFDSELEVIPGAQALLDAVSVPMCVVSNGPVSKMQHSLVVRIGAEIKHFHAGGNPRLSAGAGVIDQNAVFNVHIHRFCRMEH